MTDKAFYRLISPLRLRERRVLTLRRALLTLRRIGTLHRLTKQRVHQIEKAALKKLGVDKNIYGRRNK